MTRQDPRRAILDHIRVELGATTVCLIDASTGLLVSASAAENDGARTDLGIVAVGCTDVLRSQEMLSSAMASTARVEDIMVVTGDAFHIYHPVPEQPGWFLWAVIRRPDHSLALARLHLERLTRLLLETPTTSLLAG